MTRSDTQRLDDIREICAKAAELVGRGRAAFDEDDALWFALERMVKVVGEAATNVTAQTKAQYPEVEWESIVGSRIIYAHKYHLVDRELLWSTAEKSLPKLLRGLGPVGE